MNVFELMAVLKLNSDSYKEGLDKAKNEGEGFASSFGHSVAKGFGTLASVSAKALAASTAAVGVFAKSAIEAGATFDSSMSQVGATMGFTMEELSDSTSQASKTMQQLSEFAQKMGSTTAFSASEAADALNYMALAGYDANTSMEMLPNVLNLAAAGGIDLASASDMVTDAQSALGLTLEETSVMVDQMAKASSKSNTSVEQLGEAFLTIGANAQSLSGGTKELSTALGVLANSGIKGAEGGTHLRNVLLSLQSPTDTAAGLMEELGIDVYDASGQMLPLNEILMDLNESMLQMTDAEKTNVISTIFNKTDLAAANALLASAGDEWENLAEAIGDSEGAAQAMADVQLDNLTGDITLFKSALEGAQIAVSNKLTPSLRQFVQFGSSGLSKLTAAFNEKGLSGAMDELGNILSEGLEMIIEMLPQAVEAGAQLLESLLQGVTDNIPMIMDSAIVILETMADAILDNVPLLLESAITIITTLAAGMSDVLPELIPKVIDALIETIITLVSNADKLLEAGLSIILGIATGLINAIPELVKKAPEIILALIEEIPRILVDLVTNLYSMGLAVITAIWDAIVNSFNYLQEHGGEIIDTIVQAGIDALGAIVELGKKIVEKLWEGIKASWGWLKNNFNALISTLWGNATIATSLKDAMVQQSSQGAPEYFGSFNTPMAKKVQEQYNIQVNSNVTLEGDSAELFRVVEQQNRVNTRATGYNLLAMTED